MTATEQDRDWPERAWVLGALGGVVGLAVHALVNVEKYRQTEDPLRLGAAALLITTGLAFGYVLERTRIASSAAFAGISGIIVASTVYWNGSPFDNGGFGEPWRLVCALLTVAIAAPLFAAWRDAGSTRHIPYGQAHNRAWTNVVLWGASWGFALIVWLLAHLLGELFGLIGMTWLKELLRDDWFPLTLIGAAVGTGIGVLRDREAILGTLQRVATTVLAVLAPVLAVGLAIFLLSTPFTGLKPLWEATRNTTPILLMCVIGALILANAVLRDAPEDEARSPALRWAAMLLGVTMLPLGIIAAISTALRVQQYGLTPDRLWAVVFAGVAVAYGLAYIVALVRGRMAWSEHVRPANLRLGLGLCVLAFVLSTPLLSFGAMSTRDQVARLKDGRTKPDQFDWRALRWDFGPAGKAAAADLAKRGATPSIRMAASDALASTRRYDLESPDPKRKSLEQRLTVLPKPVPLPDDLRRRIAASGPCGWGDHKCVVLFEPGASEAIVVSANQSEVIRRGAKGWDERGTGDVVVVTTMADTSKGDVADQELIKGPITIGKVEYRQVFVNGQPVGQPFK